MEKINKQIGLYILNYNGVSWLKMNLPNIIDYSPSAQIIVIDNNSTDDSIKYLKTLSEKIEVKKNKLNYGFAKGYNNTLLKEKRFEHFIIMNNDVRVTKGWIHPLIETMKKKDIGIVQPKIKNFKTTNKKTNIVLSKYFDYAGGAGGFIDLFGIPFCRGRIINTIEIDKGQYDINRSIFWASGCCFMIKRKLFQEIGGFDEDFFMHQEEIALCWRAQGLNQKTYFKSESVIYHFGGGTLPYQHPKKTYYNHRNSLLLIIKNLHFSATLFTILIKFLIDYCIILYYLFSGRMKNIFFILLAHVSFILLLPKFLKKRKAVKPNSMYKGSILIDYYLRSKKKFSDLKQF